MYDVTKMVLHISDSKLISHLLFAETKNQHSCYLILACGISSQRVVYAGDNILRRIWN